MTATGALEGNAVLYFRNRLLTTGNLCRDSVSLEVSVKYTSTSVLAFILSA